MEKLFKIRCSGIWAIMTEAQWTNYNEKLIKKRQELEENWIKYQWIHDTTMKSAINLFNKCNKIKQEILELEEKSKEVILSKTCIEHLEDRVKKEYYWRENMYRSDALDKWTECENEAIFVLNKALWTNYKKSVYNNWEKMENERCTWHEDIDWWDHTIDTKVSLSFNSFPILKEDFEKDYRRQGQWYMRLKWENYLYHKVAKVLVNSPERLLKSKLYVEYMNLSKKYEWNEEYFDEDYQINAKKIFLAHVFDKSLSINSNWLDISLQDHEVIPRDKRVKIYKFERDNNAIEKIKRRVEECRAFLKKEWY